MKEVNVKNKVVILRTYDFEKDPMRLTRYLFTKMNNEKGLEDLVKEDRTFQKSINDYKRFVAEIDGELYATLTLIRDRWERDKFGLYSVVTAEIYRNTGLSSLLFQYAIKWVKEQHCRILIVNTREDNYQARKFFEKLGFKQYGILPKGLRTEVGKGFIDQIDYYLYLENTKS